MSVAATEPEVKEAAPEVNGTPKEHNHGDGGGADADAPLVSLSDKAAEKVKEISRAVEYRTGTHCRNAQMSRNADIGVSLKTSRPARSPIVTVRLSMASAIRTAGMKAGL